MLLNFTVENFRSFYERKTLTLEAESLKELDDNVISNNSYELVKTAGIYGANSSGKSNLIYALGCMRYIILSSVKLNDNEDLEYDPFLLFKTDDSISKATPTTFEIQFLISEYCYRYGFRYSSDRILDEWLFCKTTPRSKENYLFIRTEEGIGVNEHLFEEGIGLENKLNDNRLFLSLCQQLGGSISKKIYFWFTDKLNIVSGLNNSGYNDFSKKFFHKHMDNSEKALAFFEKIKLGFNRIKTSEKNIQLTDSSNVSDELKSVWGKLKGKKRIEVKAEHNVYDIGGNVVGKKMFDFDDRESDGTRKLFDMSGPIFTTLFDGSVLVIDELDAKMHPLISQQIVKLFNDKSTNPNDAQLIFSTHDTHLLSSRMLRRDQIWFTEKNNKEQTDLYRLMDLILPDGTKPRNDSNYEKNYIAGRYGAIPYILND